MKNNRLWIILGICILIVVVAGCSFSKPTKQVAKKGSIYYVSVNNGSDKASGKSKEKAWKTIKYALDEAKSGGEIRVLPGTYIEEVQVENAGKKAKLKVVGYDGKAVMDGQRKLNIGLWFTDSKNVTIENLEIRNYTDIGVGGENIKKMDIRNNIIHDNGFDAKLTDWEIEGYGIQIDNVDDFTIEKNKVFHNGPKPKKFPDKIMGTGIDTFGNTKGVIRDNKSYSNNGGGILVEDSKDITVEDNEVYNNDLDATADEWWDGGIWLDGGENVVIRNNNFHDNKGPGILISDEDKQEPSGYKVENNVSKENYFGIYIWNFGVNEWPDKEIITQKSNDFSDNKIKDVLINDWDYDPETLKPPKED